MRFAPQTAVCFPHSQRCVRSRDGEDDAKHRNDDDNNHGNDNDNNNSLIITISLEKEVAYGLTPAVAMHAIGEKKSSRRTSNCSGGNTNNMVAPYL